MSRAYEEYMDKTEGNENIARQIAIKVNLIHECEFHEAEYCHSNAYSFIDIEKDITEELTKYDISNDKKASIVDYIKSFESLPDKCSRCI